MNKETLKVLCAIIVLCTPLVIQSQQAIDTTSHKTYEKHSKLKWDDFKMVPPILKTKFAASVSTGISFQWEYTTRNNLPELTYTIHAHVYPKSSWVIEKEKDAELLKHEQLHYDITELFARKFRKTLQEYKIKRNIRRHLNILYKKNDKERNQMQTTYDLESKHSKDSVQQKKWEHKVANLLKEYKEFSQ